MTKMNGRADYLIQAVDKDDAIDRVHRLPDGHRASRIKASRVGHGLYRVKFLVPPKNKKRSGSGPVSHSPCLLCDHPLDDHYNRCCMVWGCGVCA